MSLSLVTAPTVEPVSLAEAKLHLRVTVADDDALISGLIPAARDYCETVTHRAIPLQTWDDKRDGFPDDGVIWLPKAPLVSVTSVTYVDPNGVTQTWSSTLYTVDAPVGPKARAGCVVPNYSLSFPSTRDVINAVTIRFVAGYAAVPSMIAACLKEHVRAHYGRGADDRAEILQWIDRTLWAFKSF